MLLRFSPYPGPVENQPWQKDFLPEKKGVAVSYTFFFCFMPG
jgi:hypothetical protein